MKSTLRRRFQELIEPAGIQIDGPNAWDPQIHDERFFRRVFLQGTLGLGESYMDGWWECARLDELVDRALRARVDRAFRSLAALPLAAAALVRNLQSRARAFIIGVRHYDIGNDLFEAMLDRRMIYSGALWRGARTLDEAQERKLEWIARKLQLERGQRVLDIGCGWGGLAIYLAERFGVQVVGVTVSRAQHLLALDRTRDMPIEIRLQDYRDLDEPFDRIVSIGMIEHVGARNYATYFDVVRRCLAPDGIFVLQTIGSLHTGKSCDPWITRYIFPNSMLPSAKHLATAAEGRMVLEDWEEIGADYDKTLMAWYANFERAWPRLAWRYGERFGRMWRYYLLTCAGSFRARTNQLWQVVYSPHGVRGGYRVRHEGIANNEPALARRWA